MRLIQQQSSDWFNYPIPCISDTFKKAKNSKIDCSAGRAFSVAPDPPAIKAIKGLHGCTTDDISRNLITTPKVNEVKQCEIHYVRGVASGIFREGEYYNRPRTSKT